jgi:transcriptional regulator of arginine metabolism
MTDVATGAPRTMTARRARIAAIIATASIGSQEELGKVLADEGINVTQATLSRDLDAIGASKAVDDQGRLHYTLTDRSSADTSIPVSGADENLARVAEELLVRAEAAGNIAVIHTPPGAAQFLAGHLDRSMLVDSVGSVAGDDTIILVMRTPEDAADLCAMMLTLAEQRRGP